MGYSLSTGKAETLAWFKENQTDVNRILDIGSGSGTYIKLIKEIAGVCTTAKWIGVEAWSDYITKFDLENRYDQIVNQDARTLNWSTLGKFDVTIAGDVLEHMTKAEAEVLVEQILDHSRWLIISIPIVHMPQDAVGGNPYEEHVKDDWSHNEIISTWPGYIKQHYRKGKKSKIGVYWLSR